MNEDPTCLIVLNYGADATIYPSKMAPSAYDRVAGKAGHEQIVLVENYGLASERVAMGWC